MCIEIKEKLEKTGLIEFIEFSKGSKSEVERPYLVSDEESVLLLYKDDNPFQNEKLLQYKGKSVKILGNYNNSGTFIVEEVCELQPEEK